MDRNRVRYSEEPNPYATMDGGDCMPFDDNHHHHGVNTDFTASVQDDIIAQLIEGQSEPPPYAYNNCNRTLRKRVSLHTTTRPSPFDDDDDDGGDANDKYVLPSSTNDLLYDKDAIDAAKRRGWWWWLTDGAWIEASASIQSLAARFLPAWYTDIQIEEAATRWRGTERIVRLWENVRWPIACTLATLTLLIVIWWTFGPTILWLSGFTSATLFKPRTASANDAETLMYAASRVDGLGTAIHDPLPLCDLLYSRSEEAQLADEAAAALSRRIGARIKKDPRIEADDGERLFTTHVADHRSGPRWDHLERHDAVRPQLPRVIEPLPIAMAELARERQEAVQNRNWDRAMGISISKATKLFHATTVAWLRRECAVQDRSAQRIAEFSRQVAETGAFVVNVTEYIRPSPPRDEILIASENTTTTTTDPDAAEQDYIGKEQGSERDTVLDELLHVYDANDGDDADDSAADAAALVTEDHSPHYEVAGTTTTTTSMEPDQSPERSSEAYRNVSAYDLHAMLYHLAAQGRAVKVIRRTHINRAVDMGAKMAAIVADFAPHPSVAEGEDAVEILAAKELMELEREGDDAIAALRSRVLWTGETSCVCPHHVGVPIPGAAWTEISGSSATTGAKYKTKVLFYPILPEWLELDDNDDQLSSSTPSPLPGDAGLLDSLSKAASNAASALGEFITTSASSGTRGAEERISMAVSAYDPVFGGGDIHRLGYDPLVPVSWVEGIDFRGQRQRLRVSPASLACLVSCVRACS